MLIEYARRHIPEYRPNFKVDQTTRHEDVVAAGLEADLSRLPPEGLELLRRLLEIELLPEEEDPTSEETAA